MYFSSIRTLPRVRPPLNNVCARPQQLQPPSPIGPQLRPLPSGLNSQHRHGDTRSQHKHRHPGSGSGRMRNEAVRQRRPFEQTSHSWEPPASHNPPTLALDTMIPVFPDDNDSLSVRCLMSNAGHGETWDIPPELEWLHCPGRSELVTPDSGMGRLRLLSSELLIRDIDWATSGPDKWASAPSRQIYLQRRARHWLRRDKQHIIRAQCLQTCSNTHRQLPKH